MTATATFDTAKRGGATLADTAEYFVDAVGDVSTGIAITGLDTTMTKETVSFTIDLTGLKSGAHSLFVRGRDSSGAWGPVRSVAFRVDHDGPLVTGVVLSAKNVNGQVDLTYSATVDETTTGASNVVSAGAVIPGSVPRPVCRPSPGSSDGTPAGDDAHGHHHRHQRPTRRGRGQRSGLRLPPEALPPTHGPGPLNLLTEGTHTLWIQGQDQWGQWGAPTATQFVVDTTAPTTQVVTLRPSATNGTSGNPAKPGTIGVTADVIDPKNYTGPIDLGNTIARTEMYLNTVAPSGSVSGIQMSYVGPGAALGSSQYTADMPLSWLGGYKTSQPLSGPSAVKVFVVAKDTAGNRGAGISTPLNIDKEVPLTTAAVAGDLVQGTGVPG